MGCANTKIMHQLQGEVREIAMKYGAANSWEATFIELNQEGDAVAILGKVAFAYGDATRFRRHQERQSAIKLQRTGYLQKSVRVVERDGSETAKLRTISLDKDYALAMQVGPLERTPCVNGLPAFADVDIAAFYGHDTAIPTAASEGESSSGAGSGTGASSDSGAEARQVSDLNAFVIATAQEEPDSPERWVFTIIAQHSHAFVYDGDFPPCLGRKPRASDMDESHLIAVFVPDFSSFTRGSFTDGKLFLDRDFFPPEEQEEAMRLAAAVAANGGYYPPVSGESMVGAFSAAARGASEVDVGAAEAGSAVAGAGAAPVSSTQSLQQQQQEQMEQQPQHDSSTATAASTVSSVVVGSPASATALERVLVVLVEALSVQRAREYG